MLTENIIKTIDVKIKVNNVKMQTRGEKKRSKHNILMIKIENLK